MSSLCFAHSMLCYLLKRCHPLPLSERIPERIVFGQNTDTMTFLFVETQASQLKHMDAFFSNKNRREVDEKPQMLKRCDIKGSPRNYLFHKDF